MIDVKELLESRGLTSVSGKTYPGTYSLADSGNFNTEQLANRDSASWKKAEHIILKECTAISSERLKLQWLKLTMDGKHHQFLYRPLGDEMYEKMNAEGKVVGTGILESFFAKGAIITNADPLQRIVYGAPGVGKSHGIEEVVKAYADTVRTTFHPDSDYASFVGCYKPTMCEVPRTYMKGEEIAKVTKGDDSLFNEGKIAYAFVPQAFTKAYIRAWQKVSVMDAQGHTPPQYLVIEEINRGNCAQIFGDLFQLLDRDTAGFSKYAIESDSDLQRYLADAFKKLNVKAEDLSAHLPADIAAKVPRILSGEILLLPANLFIWATMNTSDQSLFPMDSAFKRRWEWEFVPISDKGLNWKIKVGADAADGGAAFSWWDFIQTINRHILSTLKSEDKQLGYFFVRPDDAASGVISAKKFVNKVLFYLYNDVFKDYDLPKGFAKPDGSGVFAFGDFFREEGEVNEDAVKDLLVGLLGDLAKDSAI